MEHLGERNKLKRRMIKRKKKLSDFSFIAEGYRYMLFTFGSHETGRAEGKDNNQLLIMLEDSSDCIHLRNIVKGNNNISLERLQPRETFCNVCCKSM